MTLDVSNVTQSPDAGSDNVLDNPADSGALRGARAAETAPSSSNALAEIGQAHGATLLADNRVFPPDAFVDTTTHSLGVPIGPYTYSREAQLRNDNNGLSVSADVRLTHSSDGRTLNVQSNVSYQDTSGREISGVTVREYAIVRGSDPTGRTWSVGGNGTVGASNGGGATVGGGDTWINTNSGNVGAINLGNQDSNSRSTDGTIAIDRDSRQFDYKFDVTVTYTDGSSNTVQVGASTEPR
jgi:hypothetical protein